MLKRGDKGPAVKDLQTMLVGCGYPLTRWGIDGDLGSETLGALSMFLADHYENYVDLDRNVVTDEEIDFVRRIYDAFQKQPDKPNVPIFYDLRETSSRKNDRGPRSWSSITGITLHQTACLLGIKPDRWKTVAAHAGVMRSGAAVLLHEFDRLVWHGNGWNNRCIGVEFDGLFAGVKGNMSTVWDDPSTPQREQPVSLTKEQIVHGKEFIRWMKSYAESRGAKIRFLVAHRQASASRRNDPGQEIWQEIALPLMAELGLEDGGIGFKIGDGYPIPEVWDPRCKGIKY